MEFQNEDDFIEYLAEECEKSDKAVKKVRNCIRALRAQRNRALVEQLSNAEKNATDIVQATLQLIKTAPKQEKLQHITENEEFIEMKAAFKKSVRSLNVCSQDIQQQNLTVSYDGMSSGQVIQTQDANDEEQQAIIEADHLELEMVFNSEEVDVDQEIEAENREDAMQLAQDTVVLRDMMKDTVDMIEEQGEQLDTVDQSMEEAADTAERAVEELEAARKHQKSTQKIKVIIASICGCLILTAIIILVIRYASPPGSTILSVDAAPTTASPDIDSSQEIDSQSSVGGEDNP